MLTMTIYAILSRLEGGSINVEDNEAISSQIPLGTSVPEIQSAIQQAVGMLGKPAEELNGAQRGVIDQILSQYGGLENAPIDDGAQVDTIQQPALESV